MTPLLGVVVGDVVFLLLMLLSCLFIVGVGVGAVYAAARAGRCESCRRLTVRTAGQATLCQACRSPSRPSAPVGIDPLVAHDQFVHTLLEGYLPRHHPQGHVESAP